MVSAKEPSRSVKILIVSQYWYPENGVPQRRWMWLTKILVDAGHEVSVIAPPPHYERKIPMSRWLATAALRSHRTTETGPSQERIIRSGYFPAGSSLTQRVLNQAVVAASMLAVSLSPWSEAGKLRPDVVIGTVPALPTATVTQLIARLKRVPYAIDLRDAWPELLHENRNWNAATGRRSLREKLLRRGPLQAVTAVTGRAVTSALKHASAVLTTSEQLALQLRQQEKGSTGKRTRDVVTIRNVFPQRTQLDTQPPKAREHDGLNVLYAGTFGRAQRLENALVAAHLAQEMGVKVKLRFVGDGVSWTMLRDKAAQLGLDVDFHHRIPAGELENYYSWADTAMVHLTDWKPLDWTVPSKTFELMELGIHISGVLSGEAAELITQLEAGDVVPPERPEELARLWKSLAEDRTTLQVSEDGRQWVKEQRDKHAPQTLLDVLGRAASRQP